MSESRSRAALDCLSRYLQHPLVLLAATLLVLYLLTAKRRLENPSCEAQTSTAPNPSTAPRASLLSPTNPITLESLSRTIQDSMLRRSKQQPYDAFLVLDVEATCVEGAGFDYPNEIIVSNKYSSTYAHDGQNPMFPSENDPK